MLLKLVSENNQTSCWTVWLIDMCFIWIEWSRHIKLQKKCKSQWWRLNKERKYSWQKWKENNKSDQNDFCSQHSEQIYLWWEKFLTMNKKSKIFFKRNHILMIFFSHQWEECSDLSLDFFQESRLHLLFLVREFISLSFKF